MSGNHPAKPPTIVVCEVSNREGVEFHQRLASFLVNPSMWTRCSRVSNVQHHDRLGLHSIDGIQDLPPDESAEVLKFIENRADGTRDARVGLRL